ncbi:hypothetical protein FFLO_05067 [Filobasidium floriforme]|uniref:3-hydroxyacyl-CoA dehydrogenase n=1 Tax=Filobasidium floriforme TaxID=5210 RepID=A0A8K0NP81_9TREE|nr:uncharacterized protein HD553DRAFT_330043 [Filobasidium floriforme]KAG7530404.1 hypothetical protein FFLO_05067 [Filobasidium floriforme]KAH8078700.1 hypothetical protein HD553DRAFT_330043 [Filobasidium floriforme]
MILDGKTFVITGGLGSIGGATAAQIVAKGGNAIIFDILPEEAAKEKIKSFANPERYFYSKTDITSREVLEASLQEMLKVIPKGSLFGAVHCAATNPNVPWTNKMSDKLKDFETVLKVNAYGTFLVDALIADAINSQYAPLDVFHERVIEERGCIVNLASVVGHTPPARCLTYGPSKTCVLGITEAAADFLAPCGIRVNSLAPALVISPLMQSGDRIQYFKDAVEGYSMFPRRFTTPDEIAAACLFLLENSMMNAFHLKVDAGWRQVTSWANGVDRQIINSPSHSSDLYHLRPNAELYHEPITRP